MVVYLETDELIVGVKYHCETYDGDKCIKEYTGNGRFGPGMTLGGNVRYVFKEADMTIVELIAEMKNHRDYRDCADDPTWNRLIPRMLDVLEKAIKYKESDCDDWYGQILCTTIDRLID